MNPDIRVASLERELAAVQADHKAMASQLLQAHADASRLADQLILMRGELIEAQAHRDRLLAAAEGLLLELINVPTPLPRRPAMRVAVTALRNALSPAS